MEVGLSSSGPASSPLEASSNLHPKCFQSCGSVFGSVEFKISQGERVKKDKSEKTNGIEVKGNKGVKRAQKVLHKIFQHFVFV
jgi:hypothetical protein